MGPAGHLLARPKVRGQQVARRSLSQPGLGEAGLPTEPVDQLAEADPEVHLAERPGARQANRPAGWS